MFFSCVVVDCRLCGLESIPEVADGSRFELPASGASCGRLLTFLQHSHSSINSKWDQGAKWDQKSGPGPRAVLFRTVGHDADCGCPPDTWGAFIIGELCFLLLLVFPIVSVL